MAIELPEDVLELRANIARASLFQQTFSEEPPDYIINDPQQIKRAEQEWCGRYTFEVMLLATVARQALSYLEQSHEAAVTGFTSSVITQPQLDRFMHANLYLEELVASTLRNADSFRKLLDLFVQLPRAKR